MAGVKKIILKLFICALVLAGIDLGLGAVSNYCIKHAKNGDLYINSYMIFQAKPAVAILGSSRAKHHYVTSFIQKHYGAKTLNYGNGGTGIFQYYIIAKTIVKYNTPKVMIVDITPEEFAGMPDIWLENFYPVIDKMDVAPEDLAFISPFERYKLMSHTYRVNNRLIEIYQSMGGRSMDTALIDGYSGLTYRDSLHTATLRSNGYNPALARCLANIIALCKQHDIKPVICTSPHNFTFSYSRTMEETARMCRENNVQYLNYTNNKLILFTSNDFSDDMHLSVTGAEKFTNDLLGRIK